MMEGPTRVASLASWTLAIAAVVLVAGALLISPNEQLQRSGQLSASGGDGAPESDSGATALEPFDTSDLMVPPEQILRGGPPKDGIPALVNPHAVAAAKAEFLRPGDRVVGVTLGEQARAYPINVLNWHEIINDELGGVPIAVIYCPLCDSVSVVDRRIDGQTLTFGVSGLLHNSNVIPYDRTHQSLWSQVGLKALSGPYAGQSLKHLPWQMRPFEAWREDHPEGTVITFETGYARDYRRNPYAAYFRTDRLMFPIVRSDNRLPRKTAVVGVQIGTAARAYPLERIAQADAGRIVDTVAGARVVLRVNAATRGIVVEDAPAEARVVHTFWFAWAAFHPDTDIYGRSSTTPSQQSNGR